MPTSNKSLNAFIGGVVVGFAATAVSYAVAIWLGWITEISWLEASAVFTSYICTWMCVKQSRWNYPVGILSTVLFAWMFWELKLFGFFSLQLYLLPWLVYGWFRWKSDADPRPVTSIFDDSPLWKYAYVGATLLAFGSMVGISTTFGGRELDWLVVFDAAVFAFSVLAQFLLDNKKRENWAVWAVVNVVSIATLLMAGNYITAIQYLAFLGNTIYGWVAWNKTFNKQVLA